MTVTVTVMAPKKTTAQRRLEKKLRWFRAGVEDFASALPHAIATAAADGRELYCCPLCATSEGVRLFPVEAVLDGNLSIEHAPPEHSEGNEMALVCKRCNDTAGYTIDAAADQVERARRFFAGKGPADGRVHIDEVSIKAELNFNVGASAHIRLLGTHPDNIETLRRATIGDERRAIKLTFQYRDPNDRTAQVSWLKSAYIVMFALLGYRYALHSALAGVRLQIQEPKVEHIKHFSIRLQTDLPFSECRAFTIAHPDLPKAWGVQMGPYLVFLPGDDSNTLYAEIAKLWGSGRRFAYQATHSRWPTEPLFALEREIRLTMAKAGQT